MFTGIIEEIGTVKAVKKEHGNLLITVRSELARRLKYNESVAHNGVCLSVMPVSKKTYQVAAVKETLNRTNLRYLKRGSEINLERAMRADSRFDGHFVLGHVDAIAKCIGVKKLAGSHVFTFSFDAKERKYLVEKGSIAINGVSLTIASLGGDSFSVAIIPITLKKTVFHSIKSGDTVNIEFDVLGKYVLNFLEGKSSNTRGKQRKD